MGKKISGGKRGRAGDTEVWAASDHAIRKAIQQRKYGEKMEERERRTALLTRGSKAKREEGKVRLHIKRSQRLIEKLRERLEAWDDIGEKRLEKQREEEERKRLEEELNPPKKTGRKGPETWKLKGAARPAYQVYDFDTRYVDPHIKAHEDAKKRAQRVRNIFSIYKGRFGEEAEGIPQPHCREFLSLLMQLGNLSMQAQQIKSGRKYFLECMELDSEENPITPARCQLMRMYLESNRPDSARRLWERLSPSDPSVWIRYSAALIEFVSWKILEEENSTQESAELLLAHAIKANVFCAYYLAFFDKFADAMDYAEEIEDAHEESPLEEAIEYCNSEQMGAWQGTEGALEWVRNVILRALHARPAADVELSAVDLEWRSKITEIKEACGEDRSEKDGTEDEEQDEDEGQDEDGEQDKDEEQDEGSGEGSNNEDGSVVDLAMFAGMFETAMEMLEESGELKKEKMQAGK